MFYLVSKLFTFLLMPIGIIMILVFFILKSKNRTKTKRLACLTLLLTYVFSAPVVVNNVVSKWEADPQDLQTLANHEIGVLLTGGLFNEDVEIPENLNLRGSADRLWQTLRLYKARKINKIIISGGDISLVNKKEKTDSDYAKLFLLENGVPSDSIFLEQKSRNTNENAINTGELLKEKFRNSNVLLITSAYHMPRALGCFQKRNINATPFPSDFRSTQGHIDVLDFLPSTSDMQNLSLVWKEIIGFSIYKMAGYL